MPLVQRDLYYMAPMRNAALIAEIGILPLNRIQEVQELKQAAESIADPFVNARRASLMIDGRPLHDYVPLYWATHTPMQYVVCVKEARLPQDDLVFLVVDSTAALGVDGVLTTDGNAASAATTFFTGQGAIPHLDWVIIDTPNCYSREYKRRKAAEVLVPGEVPRTHFKRAVVRNVHAQGLLQARINRLRTAAEDAGHSMGAQLPIQIDESFYY